MHSRIIFRGETRRNGYTTRNTYGDSPLMGDFQILNPEDDGPIENWRDPSTVQVSFYAPTRWILDVLALNSEPQSLDAEAQRAKYVDVQIWDGSFKTFILHSFSQEAHNAITSLVTIKAECPKSLLYDKNSYASELKEPLYDNNKDSPNYKKLVGTRVQLAVALSKRVSNDFSQSAGFRTFVPILPLDPNWQPNEEQEAQGFVKLANIDKPGTLAISAPDPLPIALSVDELLDAWGTDYEMTTIQEEGYDGTASPFWRWVMRRRVDTNYVIDISGTNYLIDGMEGQNRYTDVLYYNSSNKLEHHYNGGTSEPESLNYRDMWMGIKTESYPSKAEAPIKNVPPPNFVIPKVPKVPASIPPGAKVVINDGKNNYPAYLNSPSKPFIKQNPVVNVNKPKPNQKLSILITGSSFIIPLNQNPELAGTWVAEDSDNNELGRVTIAKNAAVEDAVLKVEFGSGGDHVINIYEISGKGGSYTGKGRFGFNDKHGSHEAYGFSNKEKVKAIIALPLNSYMALKDSAWEWWGENILIGLNLSEGASISSKSLPVKLDFGGEEKTIKKAGDNFLRGAFNDVYFGKTEYDSTKNVTFRITQDIEFPEFPQLSEVGRSFMVYFMWSSSQNYIKYFSKIVLPRFDALSKSGDYLMAYVFKNIKCYNQGTSFSAKKNEFKLPSFSSLQSWSSGSFSFLLESSSIESLVLPEFAKLEEEMNNSYEGGILHNLTYDIEVVVYKLEREEGSISSYRWVKYYDTEIILPSMNNLKKITSPMLSRSFMNVRVGKVSFLENSLRSLTKIDSLGFLDSAFQYSRINEVNLSILTNLQTIATGELFKDMLNSSNSTSNEITQIITLPRLDNILDLGYSFMEGCFSNNRAIRSIILPALDKIQSISSRTFSDCFRDTNITSVILPLFTSVTKVGAYFMSSCFYSAGSDDILYDIVIPKTWENFKDISYDFMTSCFRQNKSINSVSWSGSWRLDSIGNNFMTSMFQDAINLKEQCPLEYRIIVKLEQTDEDGNPILNDEGEPKLNVIGGSFQYAMYRDCTSLKTLEAPEPVVPITNNSSDGLFRDKFRGCTGLEGTIIALNKDNKLKPGVTYQSTMREKQFGGTTALSASIMWNDNTQVIAPDPANGIPANFYEA